MRVRVFSDSSLIVIDSIDLKPDGTPTLSIGDGTAVNRYTASGAKTAGWNSETLSSRYPVDSGKPSIYVNVTATGGTTCLVIIRGEIMV